MTRTSTESAWPIAAPRIERLRQVHVRQRVADVGRRILMTSGRHRPDAPGA